MTFATCPAFSSLAIPVSPAPALFEITVSPVAPCASSASISPKGMPEEPKPPIITEAPSGIEATALSRSATRLSIWLSPAFLVTP